MRLREAALGCPNVTVKQATVKKLLNVDGGEWVYCEGVPIGGVAATENETNASEYFAPLTVVCDGYFSSFRKKLAKKTAPVSPSTFVGIIIDGDPNELLPRPGHGHVVLGDPSPVLTRLADHVDAAASALWLLTHEDLRNTARVRAFMDFMADALRDDVALLEGRLCPFPPEEG